MLSSQEQTEVENLLRSVIDVVQNSLSENNVRNCGIYVRDEIGRRSHFFDSGQAPTGIICIYGLHVCGLQML